MMVGEVFVVLLMAATTHVKEFDETHAMTMDVGEVWWTDSAEFGGGAKSRSLKRVTIQVPLSGTSPGPSSYSTGLVCTSSVTLTARGSGTVYT
jgi:hypothetical protein